MTDPSHRPPVLTAREAVATVRDGDTLLIEGSGGGLVEPDALIRALGERFREDGSPRGIEVVFVTAIGDNAGGGLDQLALPGLVRRAVGGMWGKSARFAQMAMDGEFEAYNLPQGVLSQLCREVAGHRPGLFTRTGIGTFCDPRLGGGRLNDVSPDDLVEVVEIDGREWLRYKPFHPDVTFLRGSWADERGNVSFEDEPARLEALAAAQAAYTNGGRVVVQVKGVVEQGSLDPRLVVVPGILVSALVAVPEQRQLTDVAHDPSLSGAQRVHRSRLPRLPGGPRRVVASRALREIAPGDVVNLGVGVADGIASVAAEQGRLDDLTLTVEQGPVGGVPARGLMFGASYNPEAVLEQPAQFDFYDGGGLDIAFLGMGEVDAHGDVNVSRFNGRLYGTGGFVNISQNTRQVVFCGTFTSGGLEVEVLDGALRVVREGSHRKFVDRVQHVTFSGRRAREEGQRILFVTERAVLGLGPEGLSLLEVAPGVDVRRDVLDLVPFEVDADDVATMDPALFTAEVPVG